MVQAAFKAGLEGPARPLRGYDALALRKGVVTLGKRYRTIGTPVKNRIKGKSEARFRLHVNGRQQMQEQERKKARVKHSVIMEDFPCSTRICHASAS